MSTLIRYRLSPTDEWKLAEIDRDPFDVCNAVRARLFPDVALPERDERFEEVMNRRQAGWEDGRRDAPAAATGSLPGAGVRDTSMVAYRSMEWSGKLTRQQKKIVDFIAGSRHRDFTRQEISSGTELPINAVCGRVRELLDAHVLEEVAGGRRECRITGESANALRLAQQMARAA